MTAGLHVCSIQYNTIRYSREGRTRRVACGPIALCMHTKFDVASFSHSRDTSFIDRITGRETDRPTDITTGLYIASFASMGGRGHKQANLTTFSTVEKAL